jgi:putative redox protein
VTTVHHVAHAVGSTGSSAPAYRVDLQVGTHQLVADEATAGGGADAGPSPFGLLLSGLAACTAMTLRMYASRKGWDLTTLDVDVRYDVTEDGTASIARAITVPLLVPVEQRERLADIAERTPVTLAVRAGTSIHTTFRTDNSHGAQP